MSLKPLANIFSYWVEEWEAATHLIPFVSQKLANALPAVSAETTPAKTYSYPLFIVLSKTSLTIIKGFLALSNMSATLSTVSSFCKVNAKVYLSLFATSFAIATPLSLLFPSSSFS